MRLKIDSRLSGFLFSLFLLCQSFSFPAEGCADIYKYQKDGVWYYTDTPSEQLPDDSLTISTDSASPKNTAPAGAHLLEGYPTRSSIERATTATVAVKSPIGYGSGFFISTIGHIITNKHVVRSTENQSKKTEERFDEIESQIKNYDQKFRQERQRLQEFELRLYEMKKKMDRETRADRRQADQQEYQSQSRKYEEWHSDYTRRYEAYKKEKERFLDGQHEYNYSKSVANLARTFTIILVDNTELYAHLIKVSANHDLALLKVDGYATPALPPGNTRTLVQGEPVYAIGNPVKLQNSVTSGVFSGFEQGFVQTNAQIYPGNSGGPLVDDDGSVLGINTFKQLTYKYEGLGFAIPIETALEEFGSYLP